MVVATDTRSAKRLETDPNHFIERLIRKYVRSSPLNRLEAFGNTPIFEHPLIGFADGDDPLFVEFKKTVSPNHLTPREFLGKHVTEVVKRPETVCPHVSVISFVMPIAQETTASNACETEGPSLRWNLTRWKGQEFANELSRHLCTTLEGMDYVAVAPEISPLYRIERTPDGFAANWSQRHAGYAAGLGTFSLNEAFITRRGLAHRMGSVITNLKLDASPRLYAHHLANCRFYARGTCGLCAKRCPAGAITEKGHDKLKCYDMLNVKQRPWLEGAHGPGYIGRYAGCGLCQCGVPCERRIPVSRKKRLA